MENSCNNSAEEMVYTTMLGDAESGIDTQFFDDPGPGDEDAGESEEEEEYEEEEGTLDSDDNPPLDDDIVHSPVPTQTGGRPKSDTGR